MLMNRATNAEGAAAQLARVAEHVSDVRVAILLTLFSCFSAIVLAVTLYGVGYQMTPFLQRTAA